ncbi:MAG: hypothetical protein ACC619_09785 [Paracoccaceae bacterium]
MVDILSALPGASIAFAVPLPPPRPTSVVPPPTETSSARTSTDNEHTRQPSPGAIRDKQDPVQDPVRETIRDERLTGPPPAFQSSLLDVETDLAYIIKSIAEAREKASNDRAVQPVPDTDTGTDAAPRPDAEKAVRDANDLRPQATPYDVRPEAPTNRLI